MLVCSKFEKIPSKSGIFARETDLIFLAFFTFASCTDSIKIYRPGYTDSTKINCPGHNILVESVTYMCTERIFDRLDGHSCMNDRLVCQQNIFTLLLALFTPKWSIIRGTLSL